MTTATGTSGVNGSTGTTNQDVQDVQDVPAATWRAWLGLAVMVGPTLMVSMDGSVLFLAVPSITDALSPTAAEQLWILDVYGFLVAGLLITMGSLGDRTGRIRLMWIGAAVFGVASALGAFAQSPEQLIAARVLMGAAGSTLLPASLALISALFQREGQRSLAIGIWAASFGVGFAAGPLVGAVLLEHFWWGSVFLINVPIVLAFLLVAPLVLREPPRHGGGRLDPASIATSFGGILLVVHALKSTAEHGPERTAVAGGVLGLVALGWFLRRQRSLAHPLLDLTLFARPLFSMAIVAAAVSVLSFAAASYLGSIYLQTVLGLSVLQAGLLALPAAATTVLFSTISGKVVGRWGPRIVLAAAFTAIGLGLLVLVLTPADDVIRGVVAYAVGGAISGIGYGMVFATASETAVTAVPASRAGSAAAVSETSFELGQALGLALLGSLAAAVFRTLGPGVAPTLDETLSRLARTGASGADAIAAQMAGFHAAVVVAGALNLALAALCAVVLRGREPVPAEGPIER